MTPTLSILNWQKQHSLFIKFLYHWPLGDNESYTQFYVVQGWSGLKNTRPTLLLAKNNCCWYIIHVHIYIYTHALTNGKQIAVYIIHNIMGKLWTLWVPWIKHWNQHIQTGWCTSQNPEALDSYHVANALMTNFTYIGFPKQILTNHCSQFTGRVFKLSCSTLTHHHIIQPVMLGNPKIWN